MTTPTRAPFGVGLLKGLGVTLKHLFRKPVTQQYPHERPDLPPRTRGVIALFDENCTVCMLCARECPDWCIYIDSHKETLPPAKEGGRERTRNSLDRFAIDFALCMYCGICVEVCPFDALFWSPEFEYSEYSIDGLLHEKEKLREWADTVPPPPLLDDGADAPVEVADAISAKERELDAAREAADEAEVADDADTEADAPKAKTAAAPGKGGGMGDVHVEGAGEQLDQDVYDQMIADGKSERMARAKAKAAWVRAQKKAKMEAEADADGAGGDGGDADTPAADADAAAPSAPRMADVHVEGAGEQLDQDVYDQMIADGKSERMARARAKAAWVRAQKKKQMDADAGAADEEDDA
ncbi:NADH-quinone oxidoreductase subunit I [Nitriliruptoria bacterium AS10]|nr:NADH-quinone oxidoreductase subunit I [Salsipaludibacter albus]